MKIIYNNRYSCTDEADKFGRWARTATYNDIRIAWISRINNDGKMWYLVTLHFPTLNNDTANEHPNFKTLEEAKAFISERLTWFKNKINES